MRITIIGVGYVGLTAGVALAYLGHNVTCIDKNEEVINDLNKGQPPIYEQGLKELLLDTKGKLTFLSSIDENIAGSDIIIIAVGTPPKSNGDADLSQVETVANVLAGFLKPSFHPVIVNKSTVPVGTARMVRTVLEKSFGAGDEVISFSVVSNPEFLREGTALRDLLYPDRIVIGVEDSHGAKCVQELYRSIIDQDFIPPRSLPRPADYHRPEIIMTDCNSAELIKYGANAFLATKISFINELSGLAERMGVNICEVARGIGLDRRIGTNYLNAGVGWGGSCLGKDVCALRFTASQYNYSVPLLEAIVSINQRQRKLVITKLQEILKIIRGKTIGVLGLAFKPLTDDLRDAPAIDIIIALLELQAQVKVYDPLAMDKFKQCYGHLSVECMANALDLADQCDALIIVTDWPDFKLLPWERLAGIMRTKVIIDGRNILSPVKMKRLGFIYQGIGQ